MAGPTSSIFQAQQAFLEYWNGVYGGDSERIASVLAQDVQGCVLDIQNDMITRTEVSGREELAKTAAKIGTRGLAILEGPVFSWAVLLEEAEGTIKMKALYVKFTQKLLMQNGLMLISEGYQKISWKINEQGKALITSIQIVEEGEMMTCRGVHEAYDYLKGKVALLVTTDS